MAAGWGGRAACYVVCCSSQGALKQTLSQGKSATALPQVLQYEYRSRLHYEDHFGLGGMGPAHDNCVA